MKPDRTVHLPEGGDSFIDAALEMNSQGELWKDKGLMKNDKISGS